MDLRIQSKVAVVIGGSSGLGLASCEAFAAEGVNLLIVGRDHEKLDEACRDLSSRFGVSATPFSADVTERAEVRSLAAQIGELGVWISLLLTPPDRQARCWTFWPRPRMNGGIRRRETSLTRR